MKRLAQYNSIGLYDMIHKFINIRGSLLGYNIKKLGILIYKVYTDTGINKQLVNALLSLKEKNKR